MKRHLSSLFSSVALCLLIGVGAETGRAAVSPGLSVVSGNGQAVWEGFRTIVPMVVQARGANGNPIPNLPVSWTITGPGNLSSPDAVTDGNGMAGTFFVGNSLPAGLSFQAGSVTAATSAGSASFVITTILNRLPNGQPGPMPLVQPLAPPQDNRNLTGKVGAVLPGAIQVQVVSLGGPQQGFPIPNIGLRIVDALNPTGPAPAVCSGPVLSDAHGVATCDLVITGAPGQYFIASEVGEFQQTNSSYLTITPGSNCVFTLSSSSTSIAAGGAFASVNVGADPSCTWSAASAASWISISGAAAGAGNGSVTFNVAANPGGARNGTLTIAGQTFTVIQAGAGSSGALAFTTAATLQAAPGAAYSTTLTASGGRPPYTFTATTALPAGLSLASTGVLSGTAPPAGSYPFGVSVADQGGASVNQSFTLNVAVNSPGQNPSITNTSFPAGVVGTGYSQLLSSIGGCTGLFSRPPVFSVVNGALPPGLSIAAQSNGTSYISGTPTTFGTFSFTLQVTDVCGRSGTSPLAITIGGTGGGPGPGPGPGPVTLAVSPAQLVFTVATGNATPSVQPINVSGGPVAFTAQAQMTAAPGYNWLSVTGGGTSPSSLNVAVTPGSLPPGVYTGYVLVQPTGGAGPQQSVMITLRVQPPPTVAVTPATLSYVYQEGKPPAGSQLTISSSGAQFDFTVAATTNSGNWLYVSPAGGSTPSVLSVLINPIGLAAGTYTGTITVNPSASGVLPLTIPVTLSIPQSGPSLRSVVNAASFQPGPIAPGELITIFGTALGPVNGLTAQLNAAGRVDTGLGEVRVYFDGAPAPIVYASAGQVSALVPYSVAGRAVTRLQVEYRGLRSAGLDLRVAGAAPGIFTLSADGQAAAVNQDGTVNSAQTGADPGSVIALYATGEGPTIPGGVDGRIMGDILAMPALPVTAEVNGVPVEVLYAGSAPNLPAGILQVNLRLPDGLPHGLPAAVVVKVGGAPSQDGVSVFIK